MSTEEQFLFSTESFRSREEQEQIWHRDFGNIDVYSGGRDDPAKRISRLTKCKSCYS